jgi:hypothetical protein
MHELCNAYWLDTDSEQGCDLPIIKDATYGFNQNTDLVATLPPSPLDNFCASAKHNSSPNTYSIDSAALISTGSGCSGSDESGSDECLDLYMYDQEKGGYIGGDYGSAAGLGNHLLKTKGLGHIQARIGSGPLSFWKQCRGVNSNNNVSRGDKLRERYLERKIKINWGRMWKTSNGQYTAAFYNAEDLESAKYLPYYARKEISAECIQQQNECDYIKNRRAYGSRTDEFLEQSCNELLTLSCSIEPSGILNTPGETCWDGRLDCSEKYDLTPLCKGIGATMLPGCKGSVDRELFEDACQGEMNQRYRHHRKNMTPTEVWMEGCETEVAKMGGVEEIYSASSTAFRNCCGYAAGIPEMINQFE